ncbi:hypothetical protein JRI60_48450 [Archangium violaceum]|uniref:hypothetical protein n=1 Tax=Archangium violaceum TaxID=83451 RepID=UPI001951E70A|nr:hypothetical protein [Archangium violaceum]QRN96732.1 hypothetical protein JRI60_48450 [Archangium violaceum]
MLTKNYQRFFILFGTGSNRKQRISSMVSEIQEPLVRLRLMDRVSVIPLVPSIESWVLADEEAIGQAGGTHLPEELPRGREQLEELLGELLGGWGPKEQKRMARFLDPERIRAKDASFDAFVRGLLAALETRVLSAAEQGSALP